MRLRNRTALARVRLNSRAFEIVKDHYVFYIYHHEGAFFCNVGGCVKRITELEYTQLMEVLTPHE